MPEIEAENSQESFQRWLNAHVVNQVRLRTLPSTSVKQLNRDWQHFQSIFQMSAWFELTAIQEATSILKHKWLKFKDEEDSDAEENQILEKFQSIRHVSIIVPRLLLGLDKLTQKYASTDAKSKNDPADFKKDLQ